MFALPASKGATVLCMSQMTISNLSMIFLKLMFLTILTNKYVLRIGIRQRTKHNIIISSILVLIHGEMWNHMLYLVI